jgi:hypothetical protein
VSRQTRFARQFSVQKSATFPNAIRCLRSRLAGNQVLIAAAITVGARRMPTPLS